jgi:hypothetical protein
MSCNLCITNYRPLAWMRRLKHTTFYKRRVRDHYAGCSVRHARASGLTCVEIFLLNAVLYNDRIGARSKDTTWLGYSTAEARRTKWSPAAVVGILRDEWCFSPWDRSPHRLNLWSTPKPPEPDALLPRSELRWMDPASLQWVHKDQFPRRA